MLLQPISRRSMRIIEFRKSISLKLMTYTLRKSHERKIWFSEVIRYLKDRQSDLLTEIQGALSETPGELKVGTTRAKMSSITLRSMPAMV